MSNDIFFNKEIIQNKSFSNQNLDAGAKEKEFSKVIYVGNVISITDDLDSNRIKVRIPELDNNINNIDLPYCYNIFGQSFKNLPKIGEAVIIIVSDPRKPYNDRLWLSPIIRNYEALNKDNNNDQNSFVGISGYYEKYLKGVKPLVLNPNSIGIVPKNNSNIIIEGRNNSDIVFGDNNIRFRFGFSDYDDKKKYNNVNQGNIFLNNDKDNKITTTIVQSDNILLLSHKGSPKPKTIIETNKDINDMFVKAHPLPFGDLLVSVLELFRTCMINHYHPAATFTPIKEDFIKKLMEFDFNSILSKGVRIN